MNTYRRPVRTFVALITVALAALALAAVPSGAAKHKNVYWVDLAGQAWSAPDFVYFVANAGGQVRNLKWKNWGGRKAIGRGRYVDTSAGYPGKLNRNGPAKLVARKPIFCTPEFGQKKGKKIRVYRHIKMVAPNGRGGKRREDVSATGGYLTCR